MPSAPTPGSAPLDDERLRPWRLVDNRGHVIFEPKTENIGQGGRLAFLNIETWLDADGEHVWLAHDCKGERVVTMLPWPKWQVVVGDHVEPSFACDRCDSHSSVKLTRRVGVMPPPDQPVPPTTLDEMGVEAAALAFIEYCDAHGYRANIKKSLGAAITAYLEATDDDR